MAPQKKQYYHSAIGKLQHPWVNKPDTKFNADGLYKAPLVLSGAAAQKLKAEVDEKAQAFFDEYAEEKGWNGSERKKWSLALPYEELEDSDGNPTGEIVFKFKQNAKIKLKDGTVKEVKIGLYDSQDNEMHKPVWSGSEGRVAYSYRLSVITASKQVGARIDFSKVQITKLASGSAGGGGFGGTVEDGYVEEDDETGFGSGASDSSASSTTEADY